VYAIVPTVFLFLSLLASQAMCPHVLKCYCLCLSCCIISHLIILSEQPMFHKFHRKNSEENLTCKSCFSLIHVFFVHCFFWSIVRLSCCHQRFGNSHDSVFACSQKGKAVLFCLGGSYMVAKAMKAVLLKFCI
jgi:hypothetical protein